LPQLAGLQQVAGQSHPARPTPTPPTGQPDSGSESSRHRQTRVLSHPVTAARRLPGRGKTHPATHTAA
jgi:hypothetical protein